MTTRFELEVTAPGRINLIGEHTDYNDGFVLPTAIDRSITFRFAKNGTAHQGQVYSENFDSLLRTDLREVRKSQEQWENYLLGVLYEIQQLTDGLKGFDCSFHSNIPIGSGVSSSAALECGFATGLNALFNLGLSKQAIVALSQRAEHHFVGTKCGIMDQFASVMSKKDHVVLLDCQSMAHEYIPIEIAPYKLILLNTQVSHNLATGAYNTRRSQCEEGVHIIQERYPEVCSLRDVSEVMLQEFQALMSPVVYRRCLYVVQENTRVLKSVAALQNKELHLFGLYMFETHKGLRQLYEVSCPELDFLVDFSKKQDQVLGARVMGGGFGGCTINLVHEQAVERFVQEASAAYYKAFAIPLKSFEAQPCEGVTYRKIRQQ
ncbi:MAG: galactokinase [Lutibacter sp.]|jgi:galactokinase|nr:galactokinase [Lutibacter sp.]